MPKKTQITIIILNYNNAPDTLACLKSLKILSPGNYGLKTVLVDNASTDSSVKQIQAQYPNLTIIYSPNNHGFAAGSNLGITRALNHKADYILLLNNDTLLDDPNLINKLLAKPADLISPVIKFKRNKQTILDYGGQVNWLSARNTHHEFQATPLQTLPPPDYLSAVCLLINNKVFRQIGLLDKSFFLYYEDADFCLRARKAGLRLALCPTATIFHQLSSSANKLKSEKIKILAQSQWLFATKHLSKISLPFYLAYHLYLRLKFFICRLRR